MSYDIAPAMGGTTLASMDANSVRHLWQQGIDTFEQTNDFFSEMEGGPDSVIWEKTDLSKGKGQKIRKKNLAIALAKAKADREKQG